VRERKGFITREKGTLDDVRNRGSPFGKKSTIDPANLIAGKKKTRGLNLKSAKRRGNRYKTFSGPCGKNSSWSITETGSLKKEIGRELSPRKLKCEEGLDV